jgi:hypothetical protein
MPCCLPAHLPNPRLVAADTQRVNNVDQSVEPINDVWLLTCPGRQCDSLLESHTVMHWVAV